MLETINPENIQLSHQHVLMLSPFFVMAVGVLLSMLLCTVPIFSAGEKKTPLFLFTLLTIVGAAVAGGFFWVKDPVLLVNYYASKAALLNFSEDAINFVVCFVFRRFLPGFARAPLELLNRAVFDPVRCSPWSDLRKRRREKRESPWRQPADCS